MTLKRTIQYIKWYLLDAAFLFLSWGNFVHCKLANSDTLWGNIDPGATLIARISNFRWLGYLGDYVSYYVLHFYPYEHQSLSLAMFLLVLSAALLLLQLTFVRIPGIADRSKWGKMVFLAVTSLCFVNVLIAELFYFTDTYLVFKASLLFAMAGCFLFSRRHYITGAVLLFLAPMFYQICCIYAALVLCTLAYLETQGQSFSAIIRREFGYLSAAVMGGVVNYLTGSRMDAVISGRLGFDILPSKQVQSNSLGWVVCNVFRQFREMYESSLGLMIPVWLPLLFSLVMTGTALLAILRFGTKRDAGIYVLYRMVSFILMCGIPVASFQGEFAGRVIAPFYTMQAMNAIAALFWLTKVPEQELRLHQWKRAVQGTAIGYLLLQCFFIQSIIANRYLSENLDISYANQILDYVVKYEARTGCKVEAAAFCVDSNYSNCYAQVHYAHSAANSRIAGVGTYSLVETVASWRNMHLGRGTMDPKVYEEYFEGKDWDHFDPEEQLVVADGVLYGCVY